MTEQWDLSGAPDDLSSEERDLKSAKRRSSHCVIRAMSVIAPPPPPMGADPRRLSDCRSKEKQPSSPNQRVEVMASVIELLLDTLADLRGVELEMFKKVFKKGHILRYDPEEKWRLPEITDTQDLVFFMVLNNGQGSVEQVCGTVELVLRKIKRGDLAARLSYSRLKKNQGWTRSSALIYKVATMKVVKELLLETLLDLDVEERSRFNWLLSFILIPRSLPCSSVLLPTDNVPMLVHQMAFIYGLQSVELTKEVFMEMNRRDLVERLPLTEAAGPSAQELGVETQRGEKPSCSEEKQSEGEHARPETLAGEAAVKKILLETLKPLSSLELRKFKSLLQLTCFQRSFSQISWRMLRKVDTADRLVDLMVEHYGGRSVEVTNEVLMDMNRDDLVRRLSETETSLRPRVEHPSKPLKKKLTVRSVKEELLKALDSLSGKELTRFKLVLLHTDMKKGQPRLPRLQLRKACRAGIVELMVQIYAQQSVEVIRKVLKKINRKDLVDRLSDISSDSRDMETKSCVAFPGPPRVLALKGCENIVKEPSDISSGYREKQSEGEHARPETLAGEAAVKKILLETLKDLSSRELSKFKSLLKSTCFQRSLSQISSRLLELIDTADGLVYLMVQHYGGRSVEVTKEVLMDMNRDDLMRRLSETETSLRPRVEHPSKPLKKQDPSGWTKLEPEVSRTDGAPTYSLESEAGKFECSVSGVRWVCKEKVSFKYHFCSWGEPLVRMENIKYVPAGPLIDIKVISGKFDEVYLPHWISTDDNPKILDKFAVLHIDDCGDVVEKASEVTRSHVKLSDPIFSPRAILVKLGFRISINCNILIYYKLLDTSLKLHVCLIPDDPFLQMTVDQKKLSGGYKSIEKPRPDKYLKINQGFNLAADIDTAEIEPKKITLRYDSQNPNFYEVFIEKPDRDFHLTLAPTEKGEPSRESVWTRKIRKEDYRDAACSEVKYSVDELSAQMHKVTITTDNERLLNVLEHLKEEEFKKYKWFLQDSATLEDLPHIPNSRLEKADRMEVASLMCQVYYQRSVEVTKKIFKKIDRNDLVQML